MKTKLSGLKKAVVIMAAALTLSGCGGIRQAVVLHLEVAEQRKWIDQRDETYFYGHKGYPCSDSQKECVERAIPKGFSKLDDWVFDNL